VIASRFFGHVKAGCCGSERRLDQYHVTRCETEQERFQITIADVAHAWATALTGMSSHPVVPADVELWLAGLTERLSAALQAQPFTAEPAYKIGAELVEAHLTDPEVLTRTVVLLAQHLPYLAGSYDTELWLRLVRLLGALSAGFARALRRRALAEQELFHRTTMAGAVASVGEERLQAVFAGAPVGMALCDADGRILEANRCLADLLGYDAEELRGADLLGLVDRDEVAEVSAQVGRLLADGTPGELRLEARLVHRDGSVRWVLLALSLIGDRADASACLVVTAQDMTERYRRQLQLTHQAYHDPLTGLPNRALFAERIHQQLFRAPVPGSIAGLCFVDLDGFKAVNDSLGYHVGDLLLAAVAGRIRGVAAAHGHLLARLGGDEFVILIAHQARPGAAAQVADEVLRVLETPFRVGEHVLRISASIGVVERPAAATSPTELLWAADMTMRRAKAGGKGRWTLFDPRHSPLE